MRSRTPRRTDGDHRVSENPYRPPGAELIQGGGAAPAGTHLGWKIFFWIAVVLTVLSGFSVPFITAMSSLDWIDLGASFVSVVGLGGLAFQKGIGRRRFWLAFFGLSVIWNIAYGIVLPLVGIPIYGQVLSVDVAYAISLVFTVLMLWALYTYAWRADHLWSHT